MHRIVCIGDTHLVLGPRRQAKLTALDQIIREGLALPDLAMWAWPGDIFHSRSSVEDRNDVALRLQLMGSRAPVLVVAGNHDQPGDLDIFAKVKASWPIYVVSRPAALDVPLATGAMATVACIPYPHKSGLIAAGVAHQDLGAAAATALDAICIDLASTVASRQAAGTLPLLLGHATIRGAISSVGQPMGLDQDIAIDAGMLARFGDIPMIFSHIHKAQALFDALYIGSITAMDFGELERKRYLVVAYDDEETSIEAHLIDTPALYHVEGDLNRGAFTWTVTKGPGGEVVPAPASWKGSEVRCRYRFAASEKSVLSTAEILAEFADADRLELQPVAVPDKALRAPEVAAAITLPEKFIKFCELGGAEATPGMLDKLAQVEQTDPVLVLRAVASAIAEIEAEDAAVLV